MRARMIAAPASQIANNACCQVTAANAEAARAADVSTGAVGGTVAAGDDTV